MGISARRLTGLCGARTVGIRVLGCRTGDVSSGVWSGDCSAADRVLLFQLQKSAVYLFVFAGEIAPGISGRRILVRVYGLHIRAGRTGRLGWKESAEGYYVFWMRWCDSRFAFVVSNHWTRSRDRNHLRGRCGSVSPAVKPHLLKQVTARTVGAVYERPRCCTLSSEFRSNSPRYAFSSNCRMPAYSTGRGLGYGCSMTSFAARSS